MASAVASSLLPQLLLIGDVGGTNARFALYHVASQKDGAVFQQTYPTVASNAIPGSGSQLEALVTRFLVDATSALAAATAAAAAAAASAAHTGSSMDTNVSALQTAAEKPLPVPSADNLLCVLAVCGPVVNGAAFCASQVMLETTGAWHFDESSVSAAAGGARVILINDFVAVGHALAAPQPGSLTAVYAPPLPPTPSGAPEVASESSQDTAFPTTTTAAADATPSAAAAAAAASAISTIPIGDSDVSCLSCLSSSPPPAPASYSCTAIGKLPTCCLGPGTGLGNVFGVWDDSLGRRRVMPSEGCMTSFAARSRLQYDFYEWIAANEGGYVPVDRIVSGQGIASWYKFFTHTDVGVRHREQLGVHQSEPAVMEGIRASSKQQQASEVAKHDAAGTDPVCKLSIDMFLDTLGQEAANLAMRYLAHGGVYIAGGGIAPKLYSRILDGRVKDAYLKQGISSSIVADIPLFVSKQVDMGLAGALALGKTTLGWSS